MLSVDAVGVLIPAVAPESIADRLGVDVSDPLLASLALAATDAAAQYLQRSITPRQYVATFETWPIVGSPGAWLSGSRARLGGFVELPMSGPIVSIDLVQSNGTTISASRYSFLNSNPARLRLLSPVEPLTVTYTAGWTNPPAAVVEAVAMLAAYLYEHRGQCDTGDAIAMSGAAALLNPYRAIVV